MENVKHIINIYVLIINENSIINIAKFTVVFPLVSLKMFHYFRG